MRGAGAAAVNAGAGGPSAPAVTLADVGKGARAKVVSVTGSGVAVQRLLEMGLTTGTEVTLVRFAPLGDPIEVKVRGYLLTLRRADARCVAVVPLAG